MQRIFLGSTSNITTTITIVITYTAITTTTIIINNNLRQSTLLQIRVRPSIIYHLPIYLHHLTAWQSSLVALWSVEHFSLRCILSRVAALLNNYL
jgi:hypothetical protein